MGFFAGGSLKHVPANGGPVQVITQARSPQGATWAADGTIVFGTADSQLLRVSATGGAATTVTQLQGADWGHYSPSFLPDGRRFLFTAKLWTTAAESSEQGIYLGSLDSPEIRRRLPDLSSAVYASPGAVVFARNGTLTAAPFDLATGRVTGPAAPVGGIVAKDESLYFAGISAAANGTLAVRPPPAALRGSFGLPFETELHVVDRAGAPRTVGAAQWFRDFMALHPDGRRLATQVFDPRTSTTDLWLVDLQRDERIPLTTVRGFAASPVWSPDGTRLAYAYSAPGQQNKVYIKDLRSGQVLPLNESATERERPMAWSPDGAYLLVNKLDGKVRGLWAWSFASRTLARFDTSTHLGAAFSPDGRYVAVTTSDSGRAEVSVTTFPARSQTWPLTREGGEVLSWRADGREILVATLSGHIVAYPVSTEGGFSAGPPEILVRDVGVAAPYSAVTRDHSNIVIRVSPDAAKDKGEIQLLFGWADAWRQGASLK